MAMKKKIVPGALNFGEKIIFRRQVLPFGDEIMKFVAKGVAF